MSDKKNKNKNPSDMTIDNLMKILYEDDTQTVKDHLISKEPIKDNFEVLNFLEKEYARLQHLDQFLTQKAVIKINYDQTIRLIAHEQAQLHEIKEQLIDRLLPITSKFNKELQHIWEQGFRQK